MYFFIEYGCLIITLIITLSAQSYVNSTYRKMEKRNSTKSISGHDVARIILDKNGLSNVKIEETAGLLSDHYDPRSKVVRLSPSIYNGSSIASVSVAAHECGHAIQDKNGYFFLKFRNNIVPLVNFASYAGYFAILIGIFSASFNLIWLGIIMEMIILLFQVVTLPVEFNASKRALNQITNLELLNKEEITSSKKMLTAAAMTYVASVATAVFQILRLILIFGGKDD